MFNWQKAAGFVLAGVTLLSLTGCIERKITVGSDPSGALVTLNDEEVGRTPITVPFVWNGDYDVILRLDKNVGTEEKPDIKHYYLHTHRKTTIPGYELFGVDFFAEIAPWQIEHEEVWAFHVPPVDNVPDDVLILRAKELKRDLTAPEELQKKGK